MIDPSAKLSVSRQAIVPGISRGSVYCRPRPVSDADLKLMHRIDKLHMEFPFSGSRMLLARHGVPEIFNTDQGSQFTSTDFIKVLAAREIKISMDGKGAWRDNVFVDRLWRTIKYEEVYLRVSTQ